MAHTIKLELSIYQGEVLREFVQHLITDMPDIQVADEEEPYSRSAKRTLEAISMKVDEALAKSKNVELVAPYKKPKKKKK
jgi:hypothetical protein